MSHRTNQPIDVTASFVRLEARHGEFSSRPPSGRRCGSQCTAGACLDVHDFDLPVEDVNDLRGFHFIR